MDQTKLQAAADAAREVLRPILGKGVMGVYAMPEPGEIYLATLGSKTTVTPAEMGEALERVGLTLQGKTPEDTEVKHKHIKPDGTVEERDAGGLTGLADAIEAQRRAEEGAEGVITRDFMVKALEITRAAAVAKGRGEAADAARQVALERMAEKEAELAAQQFSTPYGEQLCMGEIMALRCLADFLDGIPEGYHRKAIEGTRALAKLFLAAGVIGEETAREIHKAGEA